MSCTHCPDREICYRFNISSQQFSDYKHLKETYLRTLRCRRQRFG